MDFTGVPIPEDWLSGILVATSGRSHVMPLNDCTP